MTPYIHGVSRVPSTLETWWVTTPYEQKPNFCSSQDAEPVTKGTVCRKAGGGDRLVRNHPLYRRADNSKRTTLRSHREGR